MPRALLAALLIEQGRPVSNDRLIDALWGDAPPSTATKTIQKYVSQLRKHLGPIIVTHPNGYALEVPDGDVDSRRFETLVAQAGAAIRPEETVEFLEEALSLWRGEPYQEIADAPAAMAERTRLEEMRLTALEDLCQSELDLGRHGAVVGRVESLVQTHPLRERLWGQLMVALYRSGRQSDALRAYHRLCRTLAELGLEPSSELQRLEEEILVHDPGLRSTQPIPSPKSNLQPRLTSFVGRSGELAELSDLLTTSRLVTLTGPAGSGKTRLAHELAEAQLERFSDGVWFVDLAALTSPDQVADAIAAPLGVSGHVERPTEAVLKEYVRDRQIKLVIDNCEHLVAKVAALVTELLHASRRIAVLATSRERLGAPGEITYDVPPLPYPDEGGAVDEVDSVLLFVDRAQATDPHFSLDADNREAVAEICRRLDGIPLAIELAAARVNSLSPQELANQVDHRFAVLTSTIGTDLRHRTLRAAVDWSYELLDPDERTFFRRLSVFRGGFDLEAAIQVCGSEPLNSTEALPLLLNLVDKSLVVVDHSSPGHTRYRLLETLREYGLEQLDSTESSVLRNSHAAFFSELATRASVALRGPEQPEWIRMLASHHDNLRKALRWAHSEHPEMAVRMAIALSPFWDSVGPRVEGHEWLRRAVERSDTMSSELKVKARLEASDLFSSVHTSLPRRYAEEALAEARRVGDKAGEARALRALCWVMGLDQSEEAERYGLEALRIFEQLGEPWEKAQCLERLGQSKYTEVEGSIRYLEQALQLYKEVGDRKREAVTLYKLADRIAQGLGEYERAVDYVEESVAICEQIGNVHDEAHALLEYGKILRRAGDPEQGCTVLERALNRLTKMGDERCSVRTLTAMGTALIETGDTERARDVLQDSLRRGAALAEKHTSRVAIAGIARLLATSGRSSEAASLYGFVDKLTRELGVWTSPAAAEKRNKLMESLRFGMAPDEFDRAWQSGQAMNLEVAIARAIDAGDLGRPAPAR